MDMKDVLRNMTWPGGRLPATLQPAPVIPVAETATRGDPKIEVDPAKRRWTHMGKFRFHPVGRGRRPAISSVVGLGNRYDLAQHLNLFLLTNLNQASLVITEDAPDHWTVMAPGVGVVGWTDGPVDY